MGKAAERRKERAEGTEPKVLAYGMEDAAKVIGMSVSGLYKLMYQGRLRYTIVGRRRLVLVKDLEALLAEGIGGAA